MGSGQKKSVRDTCSHLLTESMEIHGIHRSYRGCTEPNQAPGFFKYQYSTCLPLCASENANNESSKVLTQAAPWQGQKWSCLLLYHYIYMDGILGGGGYR